MPQIKAFLFDLDGTLVDTERLWVAAAEQLLREKGHPISHEEALALVYGRAWSQIQAEMLRDCPNGFADGADLERQLGEVFDMLKGECDVRIHSSIDVLQRLAAAYTIAVVSGSSRSVIDEMLRVAGVADLVTTVVSTEDTPRGKPHPAPFALAAERLDVPPDQCLVFEDSRAGVLAAKAAGMQVIALQRDGAPPQDLSDADHVVADLADLPIDQWLQRAR